MNNICILGSINMDMVLRVDRMVKTGETILSKSFTKIPGGKGANQAVAARRLGANVYMIGKVGRDDNGKILLEALENDDVNLQCIYKDDIEPTGMAIITVEDSGNNSIIVVSGSNMNINEEEIHNCEEIIKNSKILIAQFETPIEITIEAFRIAKENGVFTILNPAPAKKIPESLLKYTDLIAPNETEAYELTKIKVEDENSIKQAASKFISKGVKFVVITLGERGAALVNSNEIEIIPAYKVNAIDTTAAGDSFIGAVATKLQDEEKINYDTLKKAIEFGNKVSSIVVQRQGAQTSLPKLREVLDIYKGE
ncbi:ribokinase [Clostridium rectalis]|uniref:ribokinase n=1 Tax=Clostridium rectalis TaxID=2040295 RepID=UPI000F63C130|nr:ribokinase [Clostridium rectalis]